MVAKFVHLDKSFNEKVNLIICVIIGNINIVGKKKYNVLWMGNQMTDQLVRIEARARLAAALRGKLDDLA